MTPQSQSGDLSRTEFIDVNLRESRFARADLSGVVMRAVEIAGADIDSPWLLEGENSLLINGVDVVPFIDAELNRRFPGRAERQAKDPEGLRSAWAQIEQSWDAVLARVAAMPPGTVDASVAGEWSFAQTLRHLVMATDTWLGRGILELKQPYHPIGQPNAEYETDGYEMAVFSTENPSYPEVLEARANRISMVRNFLADVTVEELRVMHREPWNPEYRATTLSCLHTIFDEEWSHQRYALRDLDALEAGRAAKG
ncbi:DinB family protein [Psychromicrobium sp. YIM B11713]|uniref:DinB family protein n=1 Tax=Psychromicrobium sp. YIM B11713 TaxID=3145233 RepID=UPI00374E5127